MQELYAVKDKNTGKFVTTLTNPNKKYWDRKIARDNAMKSPSRNYIRGFRGKKEDLIPVDYVLVEKQDYLTIQNQKAVEALKEVKNWFDDKVEEAFGDYACDQDYITLNIWDIDNYIDQLIKEYGGKE